MTPVTAFVGRDGIRIPRDALLARLGAKNYKKFTKSMTVVENVHPGKPKGMGRITRTAFFHERIPPTAGADPVDFIVVPRARAAVLVGLNIVALKAANPLPAPRTVAFKLSEELFPDGLYDYQMVAIDYLCSVVFTAARVAAHNATAYLQMGAGLGKTLTTAGLMVRLRVPVLYVVPTRDLAQQGLDELKAALPSVRCAFYENKAVKTKKGAPTAATHDVVFIVINTYREKTPEFMEGYGLTIFDEAHELHSPVNSKALRLAQTRYVLGMSATPGMRVITVNGKEQLSDEGRKDGLDKLVPVYLGPVIYQDRIPDFDAGDAKFEGEVRRIEYAGHPNFCETAVNASGTNSAIMTIANIMQDPHRTRLIAQKVAWLHNLHNSPDAAKYGLAPATATTPARRHGIIVFAEHREALPAIRSELLKVLAEDDLAVPELMPAPPGGPKEVKEAKEAKPREISLLRGGVARDELGKVRAAGAHVVLMTYGYGRRGISLREMTAMVLTSPRRNGSNQLNGRVRRRGSDQRIKRIVVDIVDTRTALKSQSTDRNKTYKLLNYTIKTEKIEFSAVKMAGAAAGAVETATEGAPEDAPGDDDGPPLTADDLFADDAMSAAVVPAKAVPATVIPAKAIPAKAAPVKAAPVKVVPAKAILAKAILAKAIPAKAVPAKAASRKTRPTAPVVFKANYDVAEIDPDAAFDPDSFYGRPVELRDVRRVVC